MPKLQDIEQFKASLKSLGRETETLARWGESWQDTEPPPQGVPDDIASLLDMDMDTQPEEPASDKESLTDTTDQDFTSFLDDMNLDEDAPLAESPSVQEIPDADMATDMSLDDFELPGAFEDDTTPEPEDDFSVPESLLENLESLSAEDETELSELPEMPEPSDETIEPDSFDNPDFPDSNDTQSSFGLPEEGTEDEFSLPDLEEEPATLEASSDEASTPSFDAGFDLGIESMEGDSFDQFDLGGLSQDTVVPELGAEDFDTQMASLDGEAITSDTFSLDTDWGGDFSIPGFEMGGDAKPEPASKTAKASPGASLAGAFGTGSPRLASEKKARAVDLSDAQVDELQDTLLSYPLNLRLAIEDIIANGKGTEAQQADLVWMLVEGASPKDSSKLAGRVLKRYIEVPSSFTKKTGAAFEAEKGSLRYVFIHSILPVLQVLILVAAGAGALFYLGYSFAYKPLKANHLYTTGYKQIELTKYGESIELFQKADALWTMKGWHYKYAEAYAAAAQYPRAEAMYDRLLKSWPKETKAALAYATMEMDLYAFAKTETVLQQHILNRDYFNKQALLLSAKNFLNWADFEQQRYNPPKTEDIAGIYEKARLQLATLMERHGRSDGYLEMMLLYLIRTERLSGVDKMSEIKPLSSYFVSNKKSAWSASTLAELADYLLDKDDTEQVNAILLSAVDRDGSVPEVHVAMGRWNRRSGFPKDELKALEFAARFFAEADTSTGLTPKRIKAYITAMLRLGELRRDDGRSLDAEDAFNIAIDRYERALTSRQFRTAPEFGRAYSLLADIYFSDRMDFSGALSLYSKAEASGFVSPETDYRRGYIHYMDPSDDGSAALRFFYRAGLDREASPYLQLATAGALYARSDYFAAQGYYSMLAARLQFELDTLSLPSPQVKPSHNEIVELLMITRNNLGTTLFRVAERMGDARKRSDAMIEFTESARLFDALERDQVSMIRPETKNLGFLNLDFALHPMRGIDLAVYRNIPTEMAYPKK